MRQRTYKQIEDSRDRRLWMTQVFIPLATLAVVLYTNNSTRAEMQRLSSNIKKKVDDKVTQIKAKRILKEVK